MLVQETLYDRRDVLQRREREPHRTGADVGARQRLCVDVRRRLFIEPNVVKRLILKLLTP